MIGTFDYRERISECQQWAEKAANDQAKALWKEMERFWRQRAIVTYLRSERVVGPATEFVGSPTRHCRHVGPCDFGGAAAATCRITRMKPLAPVLVMVTIEPIVCQQPGGNHVERYAVIASIAVLHRPPRGHLAGFPDPVRAHPDRMDVPPERLAQDDGHPGLREDDAAPRPAGISRLHRAAGRGARAGF